MRLNIVHDGADELSYDIRAIVAVAQRVAATGVAVTWENIGDPIAKGHTVPQWIKEVVRNAVRSDVAYGYVATRGLPAARQAIAAARQREAGVKLAPQDILFFNGLGDAISVLYTYLNTQARIIGPSPAYPTHSSAEGAHARAHHITYDLDPAHAWMPDIADLRNKVRYNPSVAGILVINPDNPTGAVYPRSVLEDIVAIAREYDLFIIADEIYANLVYGDVPFTPLASVLGDVPGIALRGMSKDVPWPGARCGWAEFYNTTRDATFARYAASLHDAKMLEVCATTLPQIALSHIYDDARFAQHLARQRAFYAARAAEAAAILRDIPGVRFVQPQGAFYAAIVFEDDFDARRVTDALVARMPPRVASVLQKVLRDAQRGDLRIVYALLGATGICTVPLSSFNTQLRGIRMTLLERDDATFHRAYATVAAALRG